MDARAAAVVMRAVRNTVNTGRAVVATVHQPSLEIFEVGAGRLAAAWLAVGWPWSQLCQHIVLPAAPMRLPAHLAATTHCRLPSWPNLGRSPVYPALSLD